MTKILSIVLLLIACTASANSFFLVTPDKGQLGGISTNVFPYDVNFTALINAYQYSVSANPFPDDADAEAPLFPSIPNNLFNHAGGAALEYVPATGTISGHVSAGGGDVGQATGLYDMQWMSNRFSMAAWIKQDVTNATDMFFGTSRFNSPSGGAGLVAGSNARFWFHMREAGGTAAAAGVTNNFPVIGVWMSYVGVWDGTNNFLYRDGKLVGQHVCTNPIFNGAAAWARSLTVGSAFNGTTNVLAFQAEGDIDETRIWQTNLTALQVETWHWTTAVSHGWSQFDADNLSVWSNASGVYTLSDSGPNVGDTGPGGTNAGALGAGGAQPTFTITTNLPYYSCDGGDTITINNFAEMGSGGETFSWAYWVKEDPNVPETTYHVSHYTASGNQRGWYSGNDNSLFGSLSVGLTEAGVTTDGKFYVTTNQIVTSDKWVHIACVFDANKAVTNQLKIYADGVEIDRNNFSLNLDTDVDSIHVSSANIIIGGIDGGGSATCDIQDFRMYTNALASNVVLSLATDTRGSR